MVLVGSPMPYAVYSLPQLEGPQDPQLLVAKHVHVVAFLGGVTLHEQLVEYSNHTGGRNKLLLEANVEHLNLLVATVP